MLNKFYACSGDGDVLIELKYSQKYFNSAILLKKRGAQMMRFYLLVFGLVFLCLCPIPLYAQFTPNGIGDLGWGQSPDSIKDAIYIRDYVGYPMKIYRRQQYQFMLGSDAIQNVKYLFWNNQLIRIKAESKGIADANKWRSTLEKFFGEPTYKSKDKTNGFYVSWDNVSNSDVTLSHTEHKQSNIDWVSLDVSSLKIIQQKEQFQKSLDSKASLVCNYDMDSKDCYNFRTIDKLKNSVVRVQRKNFMYSEEHSYESTSTDDYDCKNKLYRTLSSEFCVQKVDKSTYCLPREKKSQQWEPIITKSVLNWVYEEVCKNK